MRSLMGKLYQKEKKFEARIDRFGHRYTHRGDMLVTACLTNLTHRGVVYAEHTWLRDAAPLAELGALYPGQLIAFTATVDMFPRGSYQCDFHLVNVHSVKELKQKTK